MYRYTEAYKLADWHSDIFIGHMKEMDMAYRKYRADNPVTAPDPKAKVEA
jgi:hypothetical protein